MKIKGSAFETLSIMKYFDVRDNCMVTKYFGMGVKFSLCLKLPRECAFMISYYYPDLMRSSLRVDDKYDVEYIKVR